MPQHPFIVETKWEIRGRETDWKRTLVVMTNLTLNPGNKDYSSQSEVELLDVVSAYWKQNLTVIDAVNIRSVRD